MEVRFSWNAKNVHLGVRYIPMGLHRTPKVGLFSCVFRPLYSYRDYFTSSNVSNIFQQCGFVGLSGTKSVEQAHFSWKAFWLSTTWRECYRIVAMFRKIPPKPTTDSYFAILQETDSYLRKQTSRHSSGPLSLILRGASCLLKIGALGSVLPLKT